MKPPIVWNIKSGHVMFFRRSFHEYSLKDRVRSASCRLQSRGQDSLIGISLLAVFPVIWLCSSGLFPRAAIAMSFFGPLAILWVPLFLHGSVTPQDLTRSLLLPIMTLGIGISVSVLTLSMVQQQRDLEEQQRDLKAKDEELLQALETSQKQERLLNTVLETVHLGVSSSATWRTLSRPSPPRTTSSPTFPTNSGRR